MKIQKISITFFTLFLLPLGFFVVISPLVVYTLFFIPQVYVPIIYKIASLYFFAAVLFGTLGGRMVCSYICPLSGIFQFAYFVTKDKKILDGDYPPLIAILFKVFWIASFIFLIIANVLFYSMHISIFAIFTEPWLIFYHALLFVAFITTSLFLKSDTTHPICATIAFSFIGNKVGKLLHIPVYSNKVDSTKCNSCKLCDKECLSVLNVSKIVKENNNHDMSFDCMNCGECASACRRNAIIRCWHIRK